MRLGKRNLLKVVRMPDHGAYLEGGELGDILLPKRYVPEGTKIGDEVDVFLYLDHEERLVATTQHPLIEVGQFAYLECAWTNQYGAYLNWGLMKDLFCPFREQKVRMERGKRYQVYCYIDSLTYRIVCSSKIEKFMPEGEDNKSVEKSQVARDKTPGVRDKGFGPKSKPVHDRTVLIDDFSTRLHDYLRHQPDGYATFHDKSPAEEIYSKFGVSKKVFKQAVGDLYKRHIITILEGGIQLT